MTICFIHNSIASLGGIERIWTERMNLLADIDGINVYLITTDQGSHPLVYPISARIHHIDLGVRFHQIYYHSLPIRLLLKCKLERLRKKRLNNVIKQISPDIITVAFVEACSYVPDLKCNAKIIIESHVAKEFTHFNNGLKRNFISKINNSWYLHKMPMVIEKSSIIVALTNNDAKDFGKGTVVIPNLVDIKNTAYSPLTNKIAVFVGRFAYQKGLDRMLEAWKLVVNERSDWKLKLVGEGKLKEQLVRQCKELGIENNVIFAEATKDVAKEYIDSSIFLFTSRLEGFGLVLVEAMQCGVPCVSFDCPYGPSDIIDDGINGYLIENGNIEKFADAVLKLIENDDLRMQMGKAAIEKSRQYLPENIMPQWIKLYNSLTDNK